MSEFRKYTREELVRFVRSVDRAIEEPTEILVIGGAAAALQYGATTSTKDIDTWHAVPRALAKAYARAGLSKVTLQLYPGARHEMLNEINRDEVHAHLLDWLAHTLSRST